MSSEADQSEQFKFNVTESTPQGLKCKLTFADTLSISTGEIEDRIYVYMRREVFMNRDTEDWHKTYTNPYEVIELTEEEKEAELLKADQEEIKTAEDLEKEKALNETENAYPWQTFSTKKFSKLEQEAEFLFEKLKQDIPPQVEEEAAV